MDDYISRQAAFDAFSKLDYDICSKETYDNLHGYYGFTEETVNQTINNIPSADVNPIVYARWVKIFEDGEPASTQQQIGVCCSKCMKIPEDKFTESNFCPNCGADMRGNKSE